MDGSPWRPSEPPPAQQTWPPRHDAHGAPVVPSALPWPGMPLSPDSVPNLPRLHHQHHCHSPPRDHYSAHDHAGPNASATLQPMESLAGKLSQQTLEPHEEEPLANQDTAMVTHQSKRADTLTVLPRSLDRMRKQARVSRRDHLRVTRLGNAAARSAHLAQSPSQAAAADPVATKPRAVVERIPVEPLVDMSILDLEADEGYCDGTDDMSWLVESNGGMHTARTIRSNSLLTFRTSSEAALQCSLVVHKNPRMRRRRQKKLDTRLKATNALADSSGGP